jgi:hypothetical protein
MASRRLEWHGVSFAGAPICRREDTSATTFQSLAAADSCPEDIGIEAVVIAELKLRDV